MKIKKGDKVIVISGKDRGKTGTIHHAYPKTGMVLIEGVNMKKKHQKPRGSNVRRGQVVEKALPIHVSNVMIVDPKSGKGTRVGHMMRNGTKVRVTKKSQSELV